LAKELGVSQSQRTARLERWYQTYLVDQDSAAFIRQVAQQYTVGTLERLATAPRRELRRAAVLALGFLANYESNAVLGRALNDGDRAVRIAAEGGIVSVWCRDGNEEQRQLLAIIIRLNHARSFEDAARRSTELIAQVPTFAEAWNQRGIAFYSLGRFRESIHDCQRTLQINPYHFGAAAGMGQCHIQLGNHHAALECFRHALKLNPNLEAVRANITHLERALER
jgi:tetratricopeptide (TPR) repeat protein